MRRHVAPTVHSAGFAEQRLELGDHPLDRVKAGDQGGGKNSLASDGADRGAHSLALVTANLWSS